MTETSITAKDTLAQIETEFGQWYFYGSIMANDTLSRIETEFGQWYVYGNDGRMTTNVWEVLNLPRYDNGGHGWRARFKDGPHGGDYGWGPLGHTKQEAQLLLLAERVEIERQNDGEQTHE